MISRKNLRLPEYDYSSGGAYFVTVCTKNKECILGHVVGGDAQIAPYTALSPLGQICRRYLDTTPFMVTYAIMPNHIHWIVQLPCRDVDLPESRQASEVPAAGPMWASAPTRKNGSAADTIAPHAMPQSPLHSGNPAAPVGGDAHIAPHAMPQSPLHPGNTAAPVGGDAHIAPHTAPSYTLGNLVRSFKTLVTKAHGAPVWQRSYYEHIIRNDADFLSIYRYIQDNPARWADDQFYQ